MNDESGDLIETTLAKAKEIVEIREPTGALTLLDRRLFNQLLAHAHRSILTETSHHIRLAELRETQDSGHESNDRLKESVERLQRTLVQYNNPVAQDWQSVQLLGAARIFRGVLTYSFPEQIRPFLANPAIYARISMRVIMMLSSKYGVSLYEHLMLYAKRRHPVWEVRVEDLRAFLGVPADKYKQFSHLRQRVIEPAVEDVNKHSMISASVSYRKTGKTFTHIIFNVKMKSKVEIARQELANGQDTPLLIHDKELLPQVLDTPDTRQALRLLMAMGDRERLEWWHIACEKQQAEDGFRMLLDGDLDHPSVWCHYVTEDVLNASRGAITSR